MSSTTVYLADDHELVRMALRTLIDDEPDMEVVGEACDTASAIEGAVGARPDVLVLDLRMPGGGGVEVCRAVKEQAPETAILVLTSFDADEDVFSVLRAGASGYLLKETRPERLISAIRSVADGAAIFESHVAARVIAGDAHGADAGEGATLDEPLSDRETEVLELMAQGMSNKAIARELYISEATVKTHVSHVLRKLGQSDRTQAVLTAAKVGIIALDH